MLGPFIFEAAVTGTAYVTLLEEIIPCISTFFLIENCSFQHGYGQPHYYTDVRNLLDVYFPRRWVGQVWCIHSILLN
jgi:hypothetical protein